MKLIKSTYDMILTDKVLLVIYINILLMILLFLYFSGISLPKEAIESNIDYLSKNYFYEAITLLKFDIVLLSVFLSLLYKRVIKTQVLFIQRTGKTTYKIYTILGVLSILSILISIILFLIVVIGSYISYYNLDNSLVIIYGQLIIFGIYYFMLSLFVSSLNNTIYVNLGVILVYFIGTIFSPFLVKFNEITVFEEVLNLFIQDLVYLDDHTFIFIHGWLYTIISILCLFLLVLRQFYKNDII